MEFVLNVEDPKFTEPGRKGINFILAICRQERYSLWQWLRMLDFLHV